MSAGHKVSILIKETGEGTFTNTVTSGKHTLLADEPTDMGGDDTGPNPYDFVAIGLGACTSMTLRMYANHKGWDVGHIQVGVTHHKDAETKQDVFTRSICLSSTSLDEASLNRLLEIANKCPVHKTLSQTSTIISKLA